MMDVIHVAIRPQNALPLLRGRPRLSWPFKSAGDSYRNIDQLSRVNPIPLGPAHVGTPVWDYRRLAVVERKFKIALRTMLYVRNLSDADIHRSALMP